MCQRKRKQASSSKQNNNRNISQVSPGTLGALGAWDFTVPVLVFMGIKNQLKRGPEHRITRAGTSRAVLSLAISMRWQHLISRPPHRTASLTPLTQRFPTGLFSHPKLQLKVFFPLATELALSNRGSACRSTSSLRARHGRRGRRCRLKAATPQRCLQQGGDERRLRQGASAQAAGHCRPFACWPCGAEAWRGGRLRAVPLR